MLMALYEHVFIARQDISPAQVETLTTEFTKIITDHEGKVGKTEYCGLRPFSYPIKKNRKGHYVVININAPHEAVQEMERSMRINEDILRFLTVRVDIHEEAPSALFQQSRSYIDKAIRSKRFEGSNISKKSDEETPKTRLDDVLPLKGTNS
jgi:small subunit ribosomal protein S6